MQTLECCWQLLFEDLLGKLLRKLQKQMGHNYLGDEIFRVPQGLWGPASIPPSLHLDFDVGCSKKYHHFPAGLRVSIWQFHGAALMPHFSGCVRCHICLRILLSFPSCAWQTLIK